jgi:hypothetical protein
MTENQISKLLYHRENTPATSDKKNERTSILVTRTSFMGDLIMLIYTRHAYETLDEKMRKNHLRDKPIWQNNIKSQFLPPTRHHICITKL